MIEPTKSRSIVAALALSASAFVGIALHEGYRGEAYIPVHGDVPTIGFGTTEGVKSGDKTTPEKAMVRALSDISKFEGAVKRCVTVPLHQHEYDAYVSFAYNVGWPAFCKSTLVKKLNAGDYEAACNEIRKWVFFQGSPLPGLVKRRNAEAEKCLGR
ncbi:MAG: lysozyme [Betaproteobacteria bacterium]